MTYKRLLISFAATALLCGCGDNHGPRSGGEPSLRFNVASGWLGGVGDVVHDGETYHLFVQYAPGGDTFDDTGWSHATSENLTDWTFVGEAIAPDENGYISNGSVVVDSDNTSGLSESGEPVFLAYYSYVGPGAAIGRAMSPDKGMTWKKLPALSLPQAEGASAPSLIWDSVHGKWVMTLVSKASALFFSSEDCVEWNYVGTFSDAADDENVVWWESAELLLPESDDIDETKWVLLVNRNNGPANGSSATRYYVGDFDGNTFEESQYKKLWLDFGPDCSGVKVFESGEKRIALGWLNNWEYANGLSPEEYRKSLTLPRELKLARDGKNFVLVQNPVVDFESHLEFRYGKEGRKLNDGDSLVVDIPEADGTNVIRLAFDNKDHFAFWRAERFGIRLVNGDGETVTVSYDSRGEYYLLDRGGLSSEIIGASPNKEMGAMYANLEKSSDWTIVRDGGAIEFFADGGKVAMTAICPTVSDFDHLVIFADKGSVTCEKLEIGVVKR